MRHLINLFSSKQFVLFLLTGGFAAAVNFGSRILYNQWMSFSWSVILAYLTGMVTAYFLAKAFVFKASMQKTKQSVVFFALVNAVAVLQTWLVSITLDNYILPYFQIISYKHEMAHAVGVMIPVFTSYLGHKNWSFKS